MRLPDPSLPWPIPMAAVALIAEREGCRLRAYRCQAGVWTIGWGETDNVKPGDTCTQEQADRWFCEDLTERTAAVLEMMTVRPTPNQLGALVSLAYNIGLRQDKPRKRGLYHTTVRRLHNAGDFAGAARAFDLLDNFKNPLTGRMEESPGLVIRRRLESALYCTPEAGEPPEPIPQAVEPESKVALSPTMVSGAATAAGGAALALPDVAEALPQLKGIVEQARELLTAVLGPQPSWVLPLVLLAAGGAVMYWRHQQRRRGWA